MCIVAMKVEVNTGEMSQSVAYLQCKHKDLSSILSTSQNFHYWLVDIWGILNILKKIVGICLSDTNITE